MSWRGLAVGLAITLIALMLAGCANLSSLLPAPAPAASAAASAASESAEYRLEVIAPEPLRTLLINYLDLARFQSAPATEGISGAELERLALASPAQARALLETEGYFNASVKVERDPAAPGTPLLRVRVTPGPRATVAGFTLAATGALDEAAQANDAAALETLAALRRQWPIQPGQLFRQADWSSAKTVTLARLRALGYPAASWQATSAEVDAPANTVQLALSLASGPLFHLGSIEVDGLERYDAGAVRKLAAFAPGAPYREQLLLDFQERLQKLGLFEGASVEIDPNPETAAAAPVHVRVKELPLQQATVGVGYSANTGSRFSLEHTQRRVFGSRWVAKNKFELGPDLQSWQGELSSYPRDGLYRNLVDRLPRTALGR